MGRVGDLHYRRSRFSTRLAGDRWYTPSHFWVMQIDPETWRVGLTKFAARMLGDVVDIGFDARPGAAVQLGDTVGWFECFKARSDLYTVVSGTFVRGNPGLEQDVDAVDRDRYGDGWLYEVRGTPDPAACDAAGYAAILDATIDRLRGKVPQEQR
jgi:glycine cleavage system H protein